jgi:hypothetical protein
MPQSALGGTRDCGGEVEGEVRCGRVGAMQELRRRSYSNGGGSDPESNPEVCTGSAAEE